LQAINALGRSDIYLYLELIKKTIGIVIIIITVLMGNIMAIAWGVLINGTISSFINAFPNKKLLKYSYIEQIKDILPFILLSLFMGISVYCLTFLLTDVWLLLTAQILGGVIIYFAAAKLLRFESLKYITDIVKEMFNKKGK
jgi:O-antigen/teichoic acid export membrane protein